MPSQKFHLKIGNVIRFTHLACNLDNLCISKSSFAFICGVIFVDNFGFASRNQLFTAGETGAGWSHLNRLHKGSPHCWPPFVWKFWRKFGLFLSSMWFLNILSKILLLLWHSGRAGGGGAGRGGVGELETSLSWPLSSPPATGTLSPPSTCNTWRDLTWPDLSDLESLPLMESQCRSSWSSWCPSSAAAWSGRCCLVWGKLWSLTGPETAWRGPRPGRRMCWPPRGDLPPGDCAWGRWRPWAPPPGPGSSCCPSPVWPSWSCCCSVAASESSRGALAASPQS